MNTAKLCAWTYTLQTAQECRWYICYPLRVYDWRVYLLDDVATMEIGDRYRTTDTISSKLVYFGDGSSGDIVPLQGDRGPSGASCLKGDSGVKGPAGSRGRTGKRVVGLEHVVKKATMETLVVLVKKDL